MRNRHAGRSAMKQRQVGNVAILSPKGYLTGGDETEELEQTIKNLGESGNKHLIINLAETQHLNSTALGVLISAHSNYVRRGGQMKLCSVDKRIENIFVITKLSLVFDVYPSEEQALASFAERESV
ncbi:MAG: STAS domain-containing protein [Candidatus Eisenbacteria bacterium]|uniref:Anti-sigma factor antagonist n=1 Tax=Eiseniibacteriota bacterium TaxID=2212470 RepID=A0A538SEX7_UNCEI|nr:MAG: STAS domain-containing protein [Candidatus Eisenbacteria bacterium]